MTELQEINQTLKEIRDLLEDRTGIGERKRAAAIIRAFGEKKTDWQVQTFHGQYEHVFWKETLEIVAQAVERSNDVFSN